MITKFLNQSLANNYPRVSKARRDPSSVAQRFYGPLADAFAYEYANLKKQQQDFSLLRDWLPVGSLLLVQLKASDFFPSTISADGSTQYTYPTVSFDGGEELTRVETTEELFSSLPSVFILSNTLAVDNWLVYDSETEVIQAIDYDCKLIVKVSDSTEYYLVDRGEFTSGRYFVDIHGYDIHGNEITDRVYVRDDGEYLANEFFSEILDVKSQGFNGRVRIYLGSTTNGIQDPMFIGADQDNSGPLSYTIEVSEGRSVLYYWTDIEIFGANYRRNNSVLELEETEIWSQVIKDSSGDDIEAVDMAWDWNGGHLVVLDAAGFLHYYETGKGFFTGLSRASELTDTSYLEIQPLTSWCLPGDTLKLFTRFQRPRVVVSQVRIQRINPSGVIRYLQDDKTWGSGSNWIKYNTDLLTTEPAKTWQDFEFEATLDVAGEWEFYCELQDNETITITGTKVFVHELNALGSYDTGVTSDLEETPERIILGADGEYAIGTAEGNLHSLTCGRFYYYADVQNQIIWAAPFLNLRNAGDYSQIKVVY